MSPKLQGDDLEFGVRPPEKLPNPGELVKLFKDLAREIARDEISKIGLSPSFLSGGPAPARGTSSSAPANGQASKNVSEIPMAGASSPAPSMPGQTSRFPSTAAERKKYPLATGALDYFPDALMEVARTSYEGTNQHHPGSPMHWDKSKSTDEADCLLRHLAQRGTLDTDGVRHTAKVAWRALALLQRELDQERKR